jgi:hypothetical protein
MGLVMDHSRATRVAQWGTLVILLAGVAVILVPAFGSWLDGLSGAPAHVAAERRVSTVTIDEVSGYLPHQMRTETTETIPVLASGPLAFALAMPGLFFFFRMGVTALVAFIGAALLHAVLSGRFALRLPGLALGEDTNAASGWLEALKKLPLPTPSREATAPAIAAAAPAANAQRQSEEDVSYRLAPVRASLQNARATVAELRSTRVRKYEYVRDPALSIAALRLDLDESLRILAKRHGITASELRVIVDELVERGVIDRPAAEAIRQLVSLGDRAVHGERIPQEIARSIRAAAPAIFEKLDALIDGAGPPPSRASEPA